MTQKNNFHFSKNHMFYFIICICLLVVSSAGQTEVEDKQQIEEVIHNYGRAMNSSDLEGVIALYAKDAVFMPSGHPTAVGHKQIRSAYDQEFKMIDLNVAIVIDEIVQHGKFAFVRSRSDGKLTLLRSNKIISTDKYRAFFALEKTEGQWRIARFMFNFTENQ